MLRGVLTKLAIVVCILAIGQSAAVNARAASCISSTLEEYLEIQAPAKAPIIFAETVSLAERVYIQHRLRNAEIADSVMLNSNRPIHNGEEVLMLPTDGSGPHRVKISHFRINKGRRGVPILVLADGRHLPVDHIKEIGKGSNRPLVQRNPADLADARSLRKISERVRREATAEAEIKDLPPTRKVPAETDALEAKENAFRAEEAKKVDAIKAAESKIAAMERQSGSAKAPARPPARPRMFSDLAPRQKRHPVLAKFGDNTVFAKGGILADGRPINDATSKTPTVLFERKGDQTVTHVVDQVIVDKDESWRLVGVKLKDGQLKRAEELADWSIQTTEEARLAAKSAPAFRVPDEKPATATPSSPIRKFPRARRVALSPGPPTPELLSSIAKAAKKTPTPPPIPLIAKAPRAAAKARALAQGSGEIVMPKTETTVDSYLKVYKYPNGKVILPGKRITLADGRGGVIEKIIKNDQGEPDFIIKVDGIEERDIVSSKNAGRHKKLSPIPKHERTPATQSKAPPAEIEFETDKDGRVVAVGSRYQMADGQRMTVKQLTYNSENKLLIIGEVDGTGGRVAVDSSALEKALFTPHVNQNQVRPKSELDLGRYAVAARSATAPDGRLVRGGLGIASEESTIIKDSDGKYLQVTQVVVDQNSQKLLGVRVGKETYLWADELKDYTMETWKVTPADIGSKFTDPSGVVRNVEAVITDQTTGELLMVKLTDKTSVPAKDLAGYKLDITSNGVSIPRLRPQPRPPAKLPVPVHLREKE